MSQSQHPPSDPSHADLPDHDDVKDNPGIGSSKGTTMAGEDPRLIEGENTIEGDVENDADATGAPTPSERQRDHPKH